MQIRKKNMKSVSKFIQFYPSFLIVKSNQTCSCRESVSSGPVSQTHLSVS